MTFKRSIAIRLAASCGLGLYLLVFAGSASAQQDDPFADGTPQAGQSTTDVFGDTPRAVSACANVSSSMCSHANTTFLTMVAGYVGVALMIFLVWASWWTSRGSSRTTLRVALPLVLGAIACGLAVGLDPFASENYRCCVAAPTFRAALLLGDSPPVRGIVLGALPFLVLYLIALPLIQALRGSRG